MEMKLRLWALLQWQRCWRRSLTPWCKWLFVITTPRPAYTSLKPAAAVTHTHVAAFTSACLVPLGLHPIPLLKQDVSILHWAVAPAAPGEYVWAAF